MKNKGRSSKLHLFGHRFSRLEVILSAFVMLFIISLLVYVKLANFNIVSVFNKKLALELRYKRYTYLVENKKYGQWYDEFREPENKKKLSREDFIKSASKSINKKILQKNGSTIDGNTAYIDQTTISCDDDNCTSKTEKTDYKKWQYKMGNWYFVGSEVCPRETPYSMEPEFERAISLYKQRYDQKEGEHEWQWLNCVDVQYSSIPDAEGYFTFNENSTRDRLTIFVDNTYKIRDDILTTFLLSHELNHAFTFIMRLSDGYVANNTKEDCFNQEVYAFIAQLNFFTFEMNKEEQSSLNSRMLTTNKNENSPLETVLMLEQIQYEASVQCGYSNVKCLNQVITDKITQMVRENPFYQKQCAE